MACLFKGMAGWLARAESDRPLFNCLSFCSYYIIEIRLCSVVVLHFYEVFVNFHLTSFELLLFQHIYLVHLSINQPGLFYTERTSQRTVIKLCLRGMEREKERENSDKATTQSGETNKASHE